MMIREPRQRYSDEFIAESNRRDRRFIRWWIGCNLVFYGTLIAVGIVMIVSKAGN